MNKKDGLEVQEGTQKTNSSRWPIGICLAAFFVYCWVVFQKYYHLSYYDWDLAFFTQSAWNLCHGSQFSSLVGINYFGDHSYLFTFLILPLFALVPHPLTLVILKVLVFVVSAYLFYRIIQKDHPQWIAVSLMVLYLIFPSNIFAILYEFNPEAMAPVLLFLVYDFFRREKYLSFVISALLLGLIKENMLLVVFMFGLHALWTKKEGRMKWGWLPVIVSGILFVLLVFWLIPLFREMPQHAFWVRYQHIIEHPLRFLSKVITGNVKYVSDLFGPLFFPAVLAPQNLLFSAPIFAQHLLSNEVSEHTIYYHYGSTLTPFIFLAASTGLVTAGRLIKGKLYVAAVLVLFALTVGHSVHFLHAMKLRFVTKNDRMDDVRWRMIKAIPADKGVVATFEFLSPLSMREHLYSLHMLYDDSFQDPGKMKKSELFEKNVFKLPESVQYALIDKKNDVLVRAYEVKPEITAQRLGMFDREWDVVDQEGSVILLKKRSNGPDI